ncbi:MAG: hypothetical protein ACYDER_03115 [Ktedonobacteraceae bacterium]
MAEKPPTNTCLRFWATTCLACQVVTKVFAYQLICDNLPFPSRNHLLSGVGNHLPPVFLPEGGQEPSAAICVRRTLAQIAGIAASGLDTVSA